MRLGIDVREALVRRAGKGEVVFRVIDELIRTNRVDQFFLYCRPFSRGDIPWKLPPNFNLRPIFAPLFFWHISLPFQVQRDRVEVFFAPLSYLTPLFGKTKRLLLVHDLAVFHREYTSRFLSFFVERLTLNWACLKAARIMVTSLAVKDELISLLPYTKKKIVVIPLAAASDYAPRNHNEIRPILKKYGLGPGYLLSVGTLEPRKNIPLTIKAFSLLSRHVQELHPLVIVGKKGWYYRKVFDLIESLGLKKTVRYLDYVASEDLSSIYNGALCLIYPSFYEGFGLPPLEAMQSGVPVITSDISVLHEVGAGATIEVSPNDPLALKRAIQDLISDSFLARKLRQAGIARARAFSWQETTRRIWSEVESLYLKSNGIQPPNE